MGLSYDFDMFSVIPDEVQSKFQGMFNELGVSAMMSQQRALWRDPGVVDALMRADEPVKELFRASGFGINHYESGAPAGRYPARDDAARNSCLRRLAENIKAMPDLKRHNWGGFDLGEFILQTAKARPIDEVEIAALHRAAAQQARQRKRARAVLAAGVALMAVPIVGMALAG